MYIYIAIFPDHVCVCQGLKKKKKKKKTLIWSNDAIFFNPTVIHLKSSQIFNPCG